MLYIQHWWTIPLRSKSSLWSTLSAYHKKLKKSNNIWVLKDGQCLFLWFPKLKLVLVDIVLKIFSVQFGWIRLKIIQSKGTYYLKCACIVYTWLPLLFNDEIMKFAIGKRQWPFMAFTMSTRACDAMSSLFCEGPPPISTVPWNC